MACEFVFVVMRANEGLFFCGRERVVHATYMGVGCSPTYLVYYEVTGIRMYKVELCGSRPLLGERAGGETEKHKNKHKQACLVFEPHEDG